MRRSGLKGRPARPVAVSWTRTSRPKSKSKKDPSVRRTGELTQPENQHAAESSKLADNYAHVDDLDIEETFEIEAPTSSDMKAPDDKAAAAAAGPIARRQVSQIAQAGVDGAAPLIRKSAARHAVGKAPTCWAISFKDWQRRECLGTTTGRSRAGSTCAGCELGAAAKRAKFGSFGFDTHVEQCRQQADRSSAATYRPRQLADLPLPLLIGIAFGLAVLSAIVTALLISSFLDGPWGLGFTGALMRRGWKRFSGLTWLGCVWERRLSI